MLVLIADDDPLARALLTALCEGRGWKVRIAADAMQAVMYTGRDPRPDVVLMDLKMPAGTGVRALERSRAVGRTQGIPVIVVTGTAQDPAMVESLLAGGAAAVLSKPPDPEELLSLMEKVTGGGGSGEALPPSSPPVQ